MKKTYLLILALVLSMASLLPAAGCGSSEGGDGGGTPIDAGLPPVSLTAPAGTGAGEVPTFEWEAVEGAARYRLVVLDGSGATLWAWNGSETRVNLGGVPDERPEQTPGPVITEGSAWSVAAFDADGNPLAVSELRPVSP